MTVAEHAFVMIWHSVNSAEFSDQENVVALTKMLELHPS